MEETREDAPVSSVDSVAPASQEETRFPPSDTSVELPDTHRNPSRGRGLSYRNIILILLNKKYFLISKSNFTL